MHSIFIIGCGSSGARHPHCFQQTRRSFAAVCDTSPALRDTLFTAQADAFIDGKTTLLRTFEKAVLTLKINATA